MEPSDISPDPPQLPDYKLQQRDYLLRIARAMSAQLDPREVLGLVIRSAVTITGGQAGAIALQPEGEEHEVVASYRLRGQLDTHLGPLLDDLSASDDAPASRASTPQGTEDVHPPSTSITRQLDAQAESALARLELDAPEGAHQMLALPLTLSDEVIGQILVFRSQGAAVFTPLDGELLRAFADQAAVAIQNAQLHARLAARERQLATVVEHTPTGILLLDATGRIRQANREAAALLGGPAKALRDQPLGGCLTLVDEAGQTIVLPLDDAPLTRRGTLHVDGTDTGTYLQLTLTPLADAEGAPDGYVVSLVDLTAYREAENAKRAFLAGLSHELKTPLALIQGYAETLAHPEAGANDALRREAIDVILEETAHLTAMVDRLLLAARLEAGAVDLETDLLDLGALLERVVETFRRADRDHRWTLEAAPDLPPVEADPARLREVLHNLLVNAGKYAPADTTVGVTAEAGKDAVRVHVTDEGVGIAPAEQERVFERFYRATDEGEGTGLGLYMSRAIVEAHGGTLTVESQPDAGSTFTVTLPRRASDRRPGNSGSAT